MVDWSFLGWALLLLSLAISFLMSGMEAGVFSLSPLRIRRLLRKGDRRAEVLYQYLEHPENFLWTILVGNTIANFSVFVLVALAVHDWLDGQFWLSAGVYVVAIFVFYSTCELLPKFLFQHLPNRMCLMLARPFQALDKISSPIVWLVSWFSRKLLRWTGGRAFTGNFFGNREEVRYLMEQSSGSLSSDERTLINRVLELQNVTVRSITIPWENVVTVRTDTPMSEVMEIFKQRNIQRLPVWKAKENQIAGILALKTVLYSEQFPAGKTAGDFLQPAVFLEEKLRLDEAMRRMQRTGRRLAIVLGPDRREIGIVSLHDMLKVIFGEVTL